ncbi:ABC transporter ATP-binding protein [Aeoliella mucimassa]|uniref:Lipoprotein-releasing system ATP-binding protein LolD n=1 Tax=Aeoliella mucimassa TaxID=2527972 RepID=A0A518AL94_9BACT|nr:ABC transporter ATP-binding protein [Aeoliella mucimassa]QDU55466.1 Lipoprotein-releasing system ATP-binding protein LolD [Aeoliella mucimassa]
MTMLTVDNVTKEYPTPAEPLSVLRGVSLSLDRGESLAIVGPSGSGKSTLLAILGALDRPTSGQVQLGTVDPFALNDMNLAEFRRDRVGFVFQDHHLLPQLSALENVLVPLLADGKPTSADIERAEMLLGRVGLAERLTHRPAELSGGERQRAAIARALVRSPVLLLADEPTGNLDSATADSIGRLLVELQVEHQSLLVVVTHSEALAETMQQQKRIEDGKLLEN